jgi:hypothetical protein
MCDGYDVKEQLRLLRKKASTNIDGYACDWLDALWPTLLELALGASAVVKGARSFEMDHLIADDASKTIVDERWQEFFTNAHTYAELEAAPALMKNAAEKDLRTWDTNLNSAILVALCNRGVLQGEYFDPAALGRLCTTTTAGRRDMARRMVRWLGKPQIPPRKTETATCTTAGMEDEEAEQVLQTVDEKETGEYDTGTPTTMGGANPATLWIPVWRNIQTMQVVSEGDLPLHEDANWDRIFKGVTNGSPIHHLKRLEDLLPKVDALCVCVCVYIYIYACVSVCLCVCMWAGKTHRNNCRSRVCPAVRQSSSTGHHHG